ncbi:MAG TPA: hypothetical protein VJP77_03565, partial [Planctomycetota bacterium]|nr:hypothetical protein [Planctomycetota bacterium]
GGGGFYALNVAAVGDADECASLTDQDCLNGEPGNNGAAMGLGAISGASPPKGGALGPTVFIDGDLTNDFWGTRLVPAGANGVGNPATDQFVKGELLEPQAGPGGGGGGDNVKGTSFPPLPFKPTEDIKGCGGAGGGGSVQIIALQEVVFGPAGSIVADGGWGGRGESTGGINNMGGGSGAGAGGHVVLQSAKYLDFSQVNVALLPPDTFNTSSPSMDDPTVNTAVDEIKWAFVSARGGRGGPGDDNQFSEGICAGGDGGMGVIQLHVPEPVEVSGLNLVYPRIVPPGGTWDDLAQEAVPNAVDADLRRLFAPNPHVLVPSVSARSRARSTFIPLGGAAQNSFSGLGQVLFRFGGIDVSDPLGPTFGQVLSTSSVVDDEPELISQTTASIDPVGRVVTFDASFLLGQTSGDVPDETFVREPALLRSAKLTLEDGVDVGAYTVAEASFDEGTNVLTLTLDNETDGDPLSDFVAASTTARLFPRSFRVKTQLALDGLPSSASVTIRFQGVAADIDGAPDEGQIAVPKQVPGAPTWTSDIAEFNAADLLLPVDYFRFEVLFDIDANGTGLSANSPKPQLEFLRVPLRY